MHKMNPARVDREDERKMLPCRSFLDGFCPRGNRCRFYHPIPSSLPTVIRVPNLPSLFQQNTTFGQYPVHGGHQSFFSLSPTSSRSLIGFSPKLGSANGLRSSGSPTAISGRYIGTLGGLGLTQALESTTSANVPFSPTYSEYELAYAQEMEIQKEKERRATQPPQEVPEDNSQNTVFSHIDWKEFLTPGCRPPPPTHVPFMTSPGKATPENLDSLESLIRSAGNTRITSPVNLSKAAYFEDHLAGPTLADFQTVLMSQSMKKPPPGFHSDAFQPRQNVMLSVMEEKPTTPAPKGKGLSAKEELQLKVKQIAHELANEPAQHVTSLDTFFRNYTFQSMATAPSSEEDFFGSTSATTADAALQSEILKLEPEGESKVFQRISLK